MDHANPRSIPDGGTLRALPGGLRIIRRRKHEPIDATGLTAQDLRRVSDKRHGSKFLAHWDIDRLTDWIADQVAAAGWRLSPGTRSHLDRQLAEPIGLVGGDPVRTIRVVCDGRYVHAYPVED